MSEAYEKRHADGSLWAKGQTVNGQMDGYWEFFRKDGSLLRSGTFKLGQQVGEWVTYNAEGKPLKVTNFDKNPKSKTL